MRRHTLVSITTLVAAAVLGLAGCSSNASDASAASDASKPASSGAAAATPSMTPSASPSMEAYCLSDVPDAISHITHFDADGDNVEAFTTGTGPVGVVLAHQVDADLCQWKQIWPDFTAKGYRVMAISMHADITADVVAAVKQLRAQGVQKVVLVGASMGGSAVLAAAGTVTPPVQAVVSLSGPADFGGANAIAAVKTFQVPVAYFAGKQDARFADDATSMYGATTEKDKVLHIVDPSTDHGVNLWPKVKDEVLDFIGKRVG
jgi:dienelactone hydrolase